MKKINQLIILCIVSLLPMTLMGQQTAQNVILQDMNYLVYFPQDYEDNTDKKWPLLIFLHGVGECGSDVNKLKVTGLPKHIEEGNKYPFIIISPQEQERRRGWNIQKLHDFYNKIVDKYPVDKDRVYLTGLSMGGYGTWNFAIVQPELFAAIIPICGGTHYFGEIHRLKHLPIWCFHGDADTAVPISESQKIVDALNEIGGNVKFTIYEGVGHDSWTQTYLNNEIYEWLLTQKRVKNTPIEISHAILEEYAGTYISDEINLTVQFVPDNGTLKTLIKNNNENTGFTDGPTMYPSSENEFYYEEYSKDFTTFFKDSNRKVTGVRLWNRHFAKQ